MHTKTKVVPKAKDTEPVPYTDANGNVWLGGQEEAELAAEVDAKHKRIAERTAAQRDDRRHFYELVNERESTDPELARQRAQGYSDRDNMPHVARLRRGVGRDVASAATGHAQRTNGRAPRTDGRAPRERTNTHVRGSRRRGDLSRTSSSDDPPQSPTGRACVRCGQRIDQRASGARYCTDDDCVRARNADRQRAIRARDRAEPDRAAARGYRRAVKLGIAEARLCDRSCGASLENARETPDGDVLCGVCGRWRAAPSAAVNGCDELFRDMQQLDERAIGHRRHESWGLPRRRRPPPWPARTYYDVSLIDDPLREGVVLAG